jgi:AcrR family transcriptional regulator
VPKISAATLQEHRAETIDKLLDSWGDLVMEKGFDAVTLADVAAQVGLARTAIYNYFPDREALLFAWTDREVRRTVEALQQDLEKADSFAEKLRVFVRSQLIEFHQRHLPPGKEVVQFLRPETYGRFMDHIEPLEKVLRDIITDGLKAKEFSDIDPAAAVPMVMACIGAERVPLATGTDEVDVATERVSRFVLRALGA